MKDPIWLKIDGPKVEKSTECYVYLMKDTANGCYKIGMSKKPEYREKPCGRNNHRLVCPNTHPILSVVTDCSQVCGWLRPGRMSNITSPQRHENPCSTHYQCNTKLFVFETLLLIYLFQTPPILPVVNHLAGHSAVDADILASDETGLVGAKIIGWPFFSLHQKHSANPVANALHDTLVWPLLRILQVRNCCNSSLDRCCRQ